jgi:hypothetical protein
MFIPVLSKDRKPLMPTTPARARRWIKSKRATPFWSKGIFCVRLNVSVLRGVSAEGLTSFSVDTTPSQQSNNFLQAGFGLPADNHEPVVVGIDPGSKKEAFTIKSESHTYLNIQADAVTWVKDAVKTRREMRRGRRFRKTPCRKPRFNLGSYVTHPKHGVCFVGGMSKGYISLHSLLDGKRLMQNAKPQDCKHLTYASFRTFR